MLRFFRHLRKQLFLERRVSRYFGYAIGKIVLILSIGTSINADQLDDYINAEMQSRRIPGLALAVVKDGEIAKQAALILGWYRGLASHVGETGKIEMQETESPARETGVDVEALRKRYGLAEAPARESL